jgi:hypothetical protein
MHSVLHREGDQFGGQAGVTVGGCGAVARQFPPWKTVVRVPPSAAATYATTALHDAVETLWLGFHPLLIHARDRDCEGKNNGIGMTRWDARS